MAAVKVGLNGLEFFDTANPRTRNYHMQCDRYVTTTERKLDDGNRLKPASTQKYQIRKRRLIQCSIQFDIEKTNGFRLNQFMKQFTFDTIVVQMHDTGVVQRFTTPTGQTKWYQDNAELSFDRTGVATLSCQFSKYTQWEDEDTALAWEDL